MVSPLGLSGGDFTSFSGKSSAEREAKKAQQLAIFNAIQQEQAAREGIAGLQPFADIGLGGLEQFQAGSTVSGLGANLDAILNSGAFSGLVEEGQRSAQTGFAATGLQRSGFAAREAARIPLQTALGIEQSLSGRQLNLGSLGLGATTNIGNLLTGKAANQANLLTSGLETGSELRLAGRQAERDLVTDILQQGAQLAGFSDIRLKENVHEIGCIHGLSVYQWDWTDEGQELAGAQPTTGFLAQEVEQRFPEFVTEKQGYKTINYNGLMVKLNG